MQKDTRIEPHTIVVTVDNEPGVLARVIGLFAGRGYNIESLTVAEVDRAAHLSRITVVTSGTPAVIEQIKAQLGRLVPVHRVIDITVEKPGIEREMALVKVAGTGEKRVEAMRVSQIFRAHVARHDPFELRLRDHRHAVEDRCVHRTDAAVGPRRGQPHRCCRHLPRRRADVIRRSKIASFGPMTHRAP